MPGNEARQSGRCMRIMMFQYGAEAKLQAEPLLCYKCYIHTSNPFPHSLPVSHLPKMPNFAGQFLGYLTNNLFSALHTCSTTFQSRGCSHATGIVAATTEQRQRVITGVLQFLEQVCCRCCGGCPEVASYPVPRPAFRRCLVW